MMAPTLLTKLFTVYSAEFGYSMLLIYALTERQDTYIYEYILASAQERSLINPFIVHDRFQDCKYECDLTTTKCIRMFISQPLW